MSGNAQERLERLLYVLPRAAQPGGAHIGELARALDVTPADILADIEEATARVFYQPAGVVDPFNLTVEGDVVRLYGREFTRPVRLSQAEAMALGLGLRVLAAEADAQRRTELLALAQRLEQELTAPQFERVPLHRAAHIPRLRDVEPSEPPLAPFEVALGEDDFRGDIAEAIHDRVFCQVVYLKAAGQAPAEFRIAPVRLVYARGHWYVQAFEQRSGQLRNYRLDRVLQMRPTAISHDYVAADTPLAVVSDGGTPVTVRYSPNVARWVAEREGAQCEADGTLVLTYDVVDMNWLLRHVLQYGGEAVVETPEAREVVARAVGAGFRINE